MTGDDDGKHGNYSRPRRLEDSPAGLGASCKPQGESSSPGVVRPDYALQPVAGRPCIVSREVNGDGIQLPINIRRLFILAPPSPAAAQARFEPDDAGEHAKLPARPVPRTVSQKRMARDQAQMVWHITVMERIVVHGVQMRLEPHRPAL